MSKPVTKSKTTTKTGKYPPCEHFGWCPQCGRQDGSLNIGRAHYFICHAHRTRWPVGSNLFSSWREENETIWKRNHELLLTYREVDSHVLTPICLSIWLRQDFVATAATSYSIWFTQGSSV
jgi:hypothetical protein